MRRLAIRTIGTAHCKRGPTLCEECRKSGSMALCLIELFPPGETIAQRRMIEIAIGGERVWQEYEIVRTFDTEGEAREFARSNEVEDVVI